MTPARSPDPAAEAVSALPTDERTAICSALGCIDKPGVPLKFVQDLQRRLAESHRRNDELIRSWDRASPTERQELDRMRRGWGPSSPTERARRKMDVAACVQALGGALTELSVPEEDADDVPEEAQAYLDAAHDRVEKAYKAAIAVSHAIWDEPNEWPDIKAAEERGALAAEADIAALSTCAEEVETLIDAATIQADGMSAAAKWVDPDGGLRSAVFALAAAARNSPNGEKGTQFALSHLVRTLNLVEAAEAATADRDRLAEENGRLRSTGAGRSEAEAIKDIQKKGRACRS